MGDTYTIGGGKTDPKIIAMIVSIVVVAFIIAGIIVLIVLKKKGVIGKKKSKKAVDSISEDVREDYQSQKQIESDDDKHENDKL